MAKFLSLLLLAFTSSVATFAQVAITGPSYCCKGERAALSVNTETSGSWSSSNPDIASVNSKTGKVKGVSDGVAIITFTYDKGFTTLPFTVYSSANPGKITGSDNITVGKTITLSNKTDANGPRQWSSSMPRIASVDAATGVVTGISGGAATITCTTEACGSTATATKQVFVNATDCISGHVNFGGGFKGKMKVTLLHYNAKKEALETVDSAFYTCVDSSVFYHFSGLPTDSFRVKAQVCDTITYRYGFLTTFHPSNTYWFNGNLIYHTAGTADIERNITMIYGRFEH